MNRIHVLNAVNAFHIAQQQARKGQGNPPICCCFTTDKSVIEVPVAALLLALYSPAASNVAMIAELYRLEAIRLQTAPTGNQQCSGQQDGVDADQAK